MRLLFIICGIIIALLFTSCHKDNADLGLEPGDSYYPMKEGQWRIYTVDTVNIHGLLSDTIRGEVKELCSQVTENMLTGETTAIINQFTRKDDSAAWSGAIREIRVVKSKKQVLIQTGNTLYVSLVFPLAEGIRWDGNAYNDLESQEYTMEKVGEPFMVNTMTFPQTVTVNEKNVTTLISQDISRVVYAKETGTVFENKIQLVNLQSVENKHGYIIIRSIKSWSKG